MCYSAEASFIASGVLAGAGVAINRLPKEKASLPLSLIPTIFAAHQFIEGVIWLEQDKVFPEMILPVAVIAYGLIAFVLWPVFIPFAVYPVESDKRRKQLIRFCQAVGLLAGGIYLFRIFQTPISVRADCCHLTYYVDAPGKLFAPYFLAVALPFLASSHRSLVFFGLCVVASCAAAIYLTTNEAFPSVWCFFAAFLSATLYAHFRLEARAMQTQDLRHAASF
jgi:hypothetical protein